MCAKKSKKYEKEQEEFDIDHIDKKFVQKRQKMKMMESIILQDKCDFLKYKCSILTKEIKRWKKKYQSLESTNYDFDGPNMWFRDD